MWHEVWLLPCEPSVLEWCYLFARDAAARFHLARASAGSIGSQRKRPLSGVALHLLALASPGGSGRRRLDENASEPLNSEKKSHVDPSHGAMPSDSLLMLSVRM